MSYEILGPLSINTFFNRIIHEFTDLANLRILTILLEFVNSLNP